MAKPRLFIGSSVEGLPVARAIKAELDFDMDVTVWSQGVFKLSHSPLEDLSTVLDNSDFASFVFLPEDKLEIRGEEKTTVRDNVVFELGLFYGKLGRDRVSYVMPRGYDLHLPSDLTGVTGGTFEYPNTNMQASVGSYCEQIRQQTQLLQVSYPTAGYYGANILHKDIFSVKHTASFRTITPDSIEILVKIENKTPNVNYAFDNNSTGNWKIGIPISINPNILYITGKKVSDSDVCFRIMNEGDINITVLENNKEIFSKDMHIEP